jgi:hypothetical protein
VGLEYKNRFFFHGATAPSGPGLPHYRGFTITLRHTTIGRTPLDEGSARRRDLYLTTHNTVQETNIRASGGIQTHDPSRRSAADLLLRPRGHWDRRKEAHCSKFYCFRNVWCMCVCVRACVRACARVCVCVCVRCVCVWVGGREAFLCCWRPQQMCGQGVLVVTLAWRVETRHTRTHKISHI